MHAVLVSLCLFFAFASTISSANSKTEDKADICARLMTSFSSKVQNSVFEILRQVHPNKMVNIKLLLQTFSAEDRSSSSSTSLYMPILTRLALNKIIVIQKENVNQDRSYLTIRGSAKNLIQLFSDLETQEKLSGEQVIIRAFLAAPLFPVDATNLAHVEETQIRLMHSTYLNFPAFGGLSLGQTTGGQYILQVRVIKGLKGPSEPISSFEGVQVLYVETDIVVADE